MQQRELKVKLLLCNMPRRHTREWMYSSTTLNLSIKWWCGQLHALAALPPPPGEGLPVPTVEESVWAPEPV
jgi:hypothetical protein